MSQDLLIDISRALEEKFYREKDAELLEYLRSQSDQELVRTELGKASKIADPNLLDDLIRIGVTVESFTAFSLIPLVRIAWADGEVAELERAAILRAAELEQIAPDSASFRLLDGWLKEGPQPIMLDTWRSYARALAKELDAASLATLKNTTLEQARRVAQAAGGFLGLGNRISKNEELALQDLAYAFDKPSELL